MYTCSFSNLLGYKTEIGVANLGDNRIIQLRPKLELSAVEYTRLRMAFAKGRPWSMCEGVSGWGQSSYMTNSLSNDTYSCIEETPINSLLFFTLLAVVVYERTS